MDDAGTTDRETAHWLQGELRLHLEAALSMHGRLARFTGALVEEHEVLQRDVERQATRMERMRAALQQAGYTRVLDSDDWRPSVNHEMGALHRRVFVLEHGCLSAQLALDAAPRTPDSVLALAHLANALAERDARPPRAPSHTVYDDVVAERARQDAQWGGPAHDDENIGSDWYDYRQKFERRARTNAARRRDALVKLAALAVAQIESLDRKHPEAAR